LRLGVGYPNQNGEDIMERKQEILLSIDGYVNIILGILLLLFPFGISSKSRDTLFDLNKKHAMDKLQMFAAHGG